MKPSVGLVAPGAGESGNQVKPPHGSKTGTGGPPGLIWLDRHGMNAVGRRDLVEHYAADLPMPLTLREAPLWCWPMVRMLWGSKPGKVLRNGAAIWDLPGPSFSPQKDWCGVAPPMLVYDAQTLEDAVARGVHLFYDPRGKSYLTANEARAVLA